MNMIATIFPQSDTAKILASEQAAQTDLDDMIGDTRVNPGIYEFHKSWSGARWVVERNQLWEMDDAEFHRKFLMPKEKWFTAVNAKHGQTCQSDPVHGGWTKETIC